MITGVVATLSKYRVVTRLGSGGMAEVYLVLAERPGGFSKLQVLKLMRSDLSEQEMPDFLQMFEDEARLAARLNHPNIVQSFEVGAEGGQPYIVMEFLEGQTLHRVQQRARHLGSGFSMDLELLVLCQVLEGLEYAHHLTDYEGKPLHIVHRDVSPQNVFITYSGQSKLVDFGVAKTLESSKTRAGVVKGKVAYMPPEQITSGPIDHRADLFSVGVLLWEAVAGQAMHAELTVYEAMGRLVRGDLPDIRAVAPHVSPELQAIVQRALELDPNERYQDAEAFRADLFGYLDTHSKVRPRDVGTAVTQLFAKERAELSQIIRRATTSEPPTVEDERPITRRLPLTDNISSDATEAAPVNTPMKQEGKIPATPHSVHSSQPGPAKKSRALGISVAALSLLLIAGLITLFMVRSQSPEPEQLARSETNIVKPAEPPAAAAIEPDLPVRAPEIAITIDAKPSEAKIELDGQALTANPYHATEQRDGREHTLTVSAPGYTALRKALRFDADIKLMLQLERIPAEDVEKPAPKVESHPTVKHAPARPGPTNKDPYIDLPPPKRTKHTVPELDKTNPWPAEPAR